jgi:signal transduction histidine kinase
LLENGIFYFAKTKMKRLISRIIAIIKNRMLRILNFYGIREMDKMKDNFISLASHELRSPLTAIKGYVELLGEHNEGKLDEESQKYLRNMGISVDRLNALINDILEISKLEGNRIPFKISIFNPKETIHKSVDEMKFQAKKKNLSLECLPCPDIQIRADKKRLGQILVNLIGNAIKYTEQGKIEIKTEVKGEELLISVNDTGIGISEENLANLFQKFYRIKNDKTRSVSGTGLGLWIARGLSKKMDGDITVESTEGVGSQFTMHLPLA